MTRRRRSKRGVGVLLVACLALAACGSSTKSASSGSSSSSGGSGGSSAPGVTATSIKVGGITYKAQLGDAQIGAAARFAAENAAGGVNGRKIDLSSVIDDGGSSSADVAAAHQLVQQDNVFAIVPVGTTPFTAATYLAQAKVPFFGWSIDPLWCANQYGFGIDGNDCNQQTEPTVPQYTDTFQRLFTDGSAKGKTVAVLSEDNVSSVAATKVFVKQWTGAGAKVVLSSNSIPTPPAVVTDYTPFAQQAITANGGKAPDLIEQVGAISDAIGLHTKLAGLGYKGIYLNFGLYDPRLVKAAAATSTVLTFAAFEANLPGVKTMTSQIKAYDPSALLDLPAEAGWLSADEFIDALKLAGPKLTRASFEAALNGGKFAPTFQGVSGKTPFPAAHSLITPCSTVVNSDGTSYSVAVPYGCVRYVPNPLLHS